MFPSDEQNRIRVSLATVLKGIVSQRLIPTVDNKRVAAFEILVKTPTIEKLILENRDYEIRDVIEKGREYYKSQSFDQHILELYDAGVITKDKAKEFATSPSDLELKMSGLNLNSSSTLGKKEAKTISKDEVFDLKE
jgi:twitching motility protein PilT